MCMLVRTMRVFAERVTYCMLKNNLAVEKKGVALLKMAIVQKVVKSKEWPRNSCEWLAVMV